MRTTRDCRSVLDWDFDDADDLPPSISNAMCDVELRYSETFVATDSCRSSTACLWSMVFTFMASHVKTVLCT